ncbi:unnamed protein product [Amoebophrya sp. A120]|nr:unnamed protein product [Amoebophrya sp. A120]|eukprot:GSA120T00007757001.1
MSIFQDLLRNWWLRSRRSCRHFLKLRSRNKSAFWHEHRAEPRLHPAVCEQINQVRPPRDADVASVLQSSFSRSGRRVCAQRRQFHRVGLCGCLLVWQHVFLGLPTWFRPFDVSGPRNEYEHGTTESETCSATRQNSTSDCRCRGAGTRKAAATTTPEAGQNRGRPSCSRESSASALLETGDKVTKQCDSHTSTRRVQTTAAFALAQSVVEPSQSLPPSTAEDLSSQNLLDDRKTDTPKYQHNIPKVFLQISPSSEGYIYKYHVKRRLSKDWKYVHWNDRKCLEFIVKTPVPGLFENARKEASLLDFPSMEEKYGVAGVNDYKASRLYQLVQFFLREKFIQGAHGADFCRMYFLYIHGGVYMDVDMMLYKNIDELIAASSSTSTNSGNQHSPEAAERPAPPPAPPSLVVLDAYRPNNRLTDNLFRPAGVMKKKMLANYDESGATSASDHVESNDLLSASKTTRPDAVISKQETEYTGVQKIFSKVYEKSLRAKIKAQVAPGADVVLSDEDSGERIETVETSDTTSTAPGGPAVIHRAATSTRGRSTAGESDVGVDHEMTTYSNLARSLFEIKVEDCEKNQQTSFLAFKPFFPPLFWLYFRKLLVEFLNENPEEEVLFCLPQAILERMRRDGVSYHENHFYGSNTNYEEEGEAEAQEKQDEPTATGTSRILADDDQDPLLPDGTSSAPLDMSRISHLYGGQGNIVKLRMSFGLQGDRDADLPDRDFFKKHLPCTAEKTNGFNMTGLTGFCRNNEDLHSTRPTASAEDGALLRQDEELQQETNTRKNPPAENNPDFNVKRNRFLSVSTRTSSSLMRRNATRHQGRSSTLSSSQPAAAELQTFTTTSIFESPLWRRNFPDVTNATLIDLGFIAVVPRHPVILEVLQDLYRTRRSVLEDPSKNYWVFCTRMWHSVQKFQRMTALAALPRSNSNGGLMEITSHEQDNRTLQTSLPRVTPAAREENRHLHLPQAWHEEEMLDQDSELDLKYTRRNNYVVDDVPVYLLNLRFKNLNKIDYIFNPQWATVPDLAVIPEKRKSTLITNALSIEEMKERQERARELQRLEEEEQNQNAAKQSRSSSAGAAGERLVEPLDVDDEETTLAAYQAGERKTSIGSAMRKMLRAASPLLTSSTSDANDLPLHLLRATTGDNIPDHVPSHQHDILSYSQHLEQLKRVYGPASAVSIKVLKMREVNTVNCGSEVLSPTIGAIFGRNCNTYFVEQEDDDLDDPRSEQINGRDDEAPVRQVGVKKTEVAVLKHFHRTKVLPEHELKLPVTDVFAYPWTNRSLFERETTLLHG